MSFLPWPHINMAPRHTIGGSNLHGKGLYAAKDIAAGEAITGERPYLTLVIPKTRRIDRTTENQLLTDAINLPDNDFFQMRGHCRRKVGEAKGRRLTKLALQTEEGRTRKDLREILSDTLVDSATKRYDPTMSSMVYALCNDLQRLNHSCNPNSEVAWHPQYPDDRPLILRATKDIKQGREILISYLPEPFHKNERRDQELAQIKFEGHCKCGLCTRNEADDGPDEALYADLERNFKILQDFNDRFWRPGMPNDMFNSNVSDYQRIRDMAAAVNQISKAERDEVVGAGEWAGKMATEFDLVHSSLDILYRVSYLLAGACAVGYGDEGKGSGEDRAAEAGSSGSGEAKGDVDDAADVLVHAMAGTSLAEQSSGSNEDEAPRPDAPRSKKVGYARQMGFESKAEELKLLILCKGPHDVQTRQAMYLAWQVADNYERQQIRATLGKMGVRIQKIQGKETHEICMSREEMEVTRWEEP